MTISITQPNTNNASHSIRITIDDVYIGSIGPGETITGQSLLSGDEPWCVVATCGLYSAEAHGLHDAAFQIAWLPNPAKMELRNVKI